MEDGTPRARRFAKACDHCFRKKVKCQLPPSATAGHPQQPCKDCEKHGRACTFTRADKDLKKPRRTARQLAVVSDRLEQVEALLAEERAKADRREPIESATDHANHHSNATGAPSSEQVVLENTPQDRAHLSDAELSLIELYFDHCNQVFPIFSKYAFLTSLLRQSFRTGVEEESTAVRSSANAMLSVALRLHAISENENAPSGEDRATLHFDRAVAELQVLTLAKPSLTTVQSLLIVACAMLGASHSTSQASVVLGIAIKQAQLLDLHLLDTLNGLSPSDRLERIRIFWCLYILDKELSLRLSKPSLLSDDDVCVLSPREISDDGLGLLSSRDNELRIGLFAARQQLAVIQHDVYTRLYTFKARHGPLSERMRAVEELNAKLQQWQIKWLSGPQVLSGNKWSSWALVHVVRLHFAHFHALMMANPRVASDQEAVRAILDEIAIGQQSMIELFSGISSALKESARITFRAAGLIRHSGLPWLMETLRFVLPAVLIILQTTIAEPQTASARDDFEQAGSWIELLVLLRSRGSSSLLETESSVISQLSNLAEQALLSVGA